MPGAKPVYEHYHGGLQDCDPCRVGVMSLTEKPTGHGAHPPSEHGNSW